MTLRAIASVSPRVSAWVRLGSLGAVVVLVPLALNPDVVVPMHCSGENFVQAMHAAAPDRLLLAASGSQLTFGA